MLHFCQNRSDYYLINVQQLRSVEEDPLNVHGTVTPTIVDLEADVNGTYILGDFGDTSTYFRNVGSREEPISA